MTSAKLATAPAEGHGLTRDICDQLYAALQDGKPLGQLVVVGLLDPVGTSQRKTAQGVHRSVTLEALRLEVLSGDDAAAVRHIITQVYESRVGADGGTQRRLPLDFGRLGDEEQRLTLIERIESHANDQQWTGKTLDNKWKSYYAVGESPTTAAGTYEKGSVVHLTEFAQSIGAIEDPDAGGGFGDDAEPGAEDSA